MSDRRARERHKVVAEAVHQLEASIQFAGGEPLAASVSDLSRWGLGFVVDVDVEPSVGQTVTVSMRHSGIPIRFHATLKWVKQVEGRWSGGCEFADELGEDFLMDLSDSKILEPEADRETTWVRAIVRSNMAPDEKYPAEIVNYSERGVCLATQIDFEPGDVLLLEIDDNYRPRTLFEANVVWARPDEGCFLQGSKFVAATDAKSFYKAVKRRMKSDQLQAETSVSSKRTSFLSGLLGR